MIQEKPAVLQAINKSTRSVINKEEKCACVCVCVCVCVKEKEREKTEPVASSHAFLLEPVFKKSFLLGASKV